MGMWYRFGQWFIRTTAARASAARRATRESVDVLPCEPDKPWGCGWFDSSLDLRQGLAVIEHEGIELGLALEQMLSPEAALY